MAHVCYTYVTCVPQVPIDDWIEHVRYFYVTCVPQVPIDDWIEHVCTATDAVVTKESFPADSPNGGRVVEAVALSVPEEGKYAIKDKDTAMAAAFAFLRSKVRRRPANRQPPASRQPPTNAPAFVHHHRVCLPPAPRTAPPLSLRLYCCAGRLPRGRRRLGRRAGLRRRCLRRDERLVDDV